MSKVVSAGVEARVNQLSTYEEALHRADSLYYDSQVNNFELGGVLMKIRLHEWFGQYRTFKNLVEGRYSFSLSKAEALISIYKYYSRVGVDWSDVCHLGWTKLELLIGTMTKANMLEWRRLAEDHNKDDLRQLIRGEDIVLIQRKTFHMKVHNLRYVNNRLKEIMEEHPNMNESDALVHMFKEYKSLRKEMA